ncbi:MAG: hypothetical protein CMI62_12805 [Parvibaculum sp.]|nr:hypothetical protein [Parvibaculum sp.]
MCPSGLIPHSRDDLAFYGVESSVVLLRLIRLPVLAASLFEIHFLCKIIDTQRQKLVRRR